MKTAQAYALMSNRDYVVPDDVKYMAPFVIAHRLILKSEAKFGGLEAHEVVGEVLDRVPVPVAKERTYQ
jgi:MoxR-like ATPase